MKYFNSLAIFLFIFGVTTCIGQQIGNSSDFVQMSEITPPPPDASALIKYNGINVNKNTGAVVKAIDLMALSTKALSIPIGIRYVTNGIRVNEYSSRVGLGWALQAGGSISRTIYGRDDLLYQREYPDFAVNPGENRPEFLTYLFNHDHGLAFDAQPDIYNFNFLGFSGRFVIDSDGEVAQLPVSNLKIIKNNGSYTEWMFKIIDPNGNVYFFGGDLATEKVKKENGAPIQGGHYAASVWHLKKIETSLGEIVTYDYEYFQDSYDLGMSQTLYKSDPYSEIAHVVNPCDMINCAPIFAFGSVPQPRFTPQISTVKGFLLKKISVPTRGEINFVYSIIGYPERLLESITLKDNKGIEAKRSVLSYDFVTPSTTYSNQYTTSVQIPFLASVKEYARSSSSDFIEHKFSYYDKSQIPQRLSFAQDHWGFFNAKLNSGLIPAPEDIQLQNWFPDAVAIREIDTAFTYKGILKSITFPTGGIEEIEYEPNQTSAKEDINTYTQLNQAIVGNSVNTYVYSTGANFNINYAHKNTITANCYYIGNGTPDPIHDGGTVSIINTVTNTTVLTYDVKLSSGSNIWFVSLAPGSYKIVCAAKGLDVRTDAAIKYIQASSPNLQYVTKYVGGVRVKRIKTFHSAPAPPMVIRFYYGSIDSLNYNLSVKVPKPNYYRQYTERIGGLGECCQTCILNYKYLRHHAMFSESVTNLYIYPDGPITYKNVVESFGGDNYENGAIAHVYESIPDIQPQLILGEKMNGTPFTNTSAYSSSSSGNNGKEILQTIFKKEGGQLIPKEKTEYQYTVEQTRKYREVLGLAINTKHEVICWYVTSNNHIQSTDLDSSFDVEKYYIISSWNHINSKTQTLYDKDGNPSLSVVSNYFFDNELHLNLTREESFDSKGKAIKAVYKYPHDVTGMGSVYTDMVSKNIIDPIIQQEKYRDNVMLEQTTTSYKAWPNNLYLPEYIQNKLKTNNVETRILFNSYDLSGNLLEQQKNNDVRQSYVWGYLNQQPVAQVTNAKASEIFHDNFEDLSGWDGSLTAYDNTRSRTGGYSGRIDKFTSGEQVSHSTKWLTIALTSPKKFRYSTWVYSTGPSAEIFLFMKRANESNYFSYVSSVQTLEINKWVLIQQDFLVPADVVQLGIRLDNNGGGSVWFDDVRLHPSDAMMTTYTYKPLVGLSSQTDINNRSAYYEYDSFNRLSIVRDTDGKIVKKICYNYVGKAENCVDCVNTAADWQNTNEYSCQKDGSNNNTGYQLRKQVDMNPCSLSYGNFQWVVSSYNTTACPLPAQTVYAKIVYENLDFTGSGTVADIKIKFYSNQACTIPLSVSNLYIGYQELYEYYDHNYGSTYSQYNYLNTANGYEFVIGYSQYIQYYGWGYDEYWDYVLLPNSSYVIQ